MAPSRLPGGTAANVIPQHCRFAVDLRVVNVADGETHSASILSLKAHDPDVKLTVAGGMNRPPYEKSAGVAKLYERAGSLALLRQPAQAIRDYREAIAIMERFERDGALEGTDVTTLADSSVMELISEGINSGKAED